MLAAEGLTIVRGGRRLVDDISIAFAPGTVTIVLGPNGAGKSTLMKALNGEMHADGGRVRLDGRDLREVRPAAAAGRRAVLPQSATLAFPFTVREIAGLGVSVPAFPIGRVEADSIVERALTAVDLSDHADTLHDALSGGERQRAHLARVLTQLWGGERLNGPGALLLDEPTAAQDIAHQLLVLDVAAAHARSGGTTVLVLHDLNLAARYADRLAVVSAGRLVAEGAPAAVLDARLLADVFHVDLTPNSLPDAGVPFVLPQTARRL